MRTRLAILIALLTLLGCGAVQFVDPHLLIIPIPPEPPIPDEGFQREQFLYGVPSGALSVGILFYPSLTMKEHVTRLRNQYRSFLTRMWQLDGQYESAHFYIGIESNPLEVRALHLSGDRSAWPSAADTFFAESLAWAESKIERAPLDIFSHAFVGLAADVVSSVRLSPLSVSPGSMHLLYFRNREVFWNAESQGQFKGAAEDLKRQLNVLPFSPHRLTVQPFVYRTDTACSVPSSGISRRMRDALPSIRVGERELCGFSDLSAAATFIYEDDRRMRLAKKPKDETLKVSVNGESLPSNEIAPLVENELQLSRPLNVGDVVDVHYEVQP